MKLRQLQQFLVVAETLNFHRAAEALHMAQPPLSASIRRLEEDLGGPLFDRSRSGVHLTAAGEAMLVHARRAVEAAGQCRQAFADAMHGEGGLIRVGFVGSATYLLLPDLIVPIRQALARVEIQLKESPTTSTISDLGARKLDVGLVRYPLLTEAPVEIEPLREDAFMLAVPASDPLARYDEVRLESVADRPFIMYTKADVPNLHALAMLLCQRAGFMPRTVQEAMHMLTMVSLVGAGLGVALLPSGARTHASSRVKFLSIMDTPADFRMGIGIATPRGDRNSLVEKFRALALRYCGRPASA